MVRKVLSLFASVVVLALLANTALASGFTNEPNDLYLAVNTATSASKLVIQPGDVLTIYTIPIAFWVKTAYDGQVFGFESLNAETALDLAPAGFALNSVVHATFVANGNALTLSELNLSVGTAVGDYGTVDLVLPLLTLKGASLSFSTSVESIAAEAGINLAFAGFKPTLYHLTVTHQKALTTIVSYFQEPGASSWLTVTTGFTFTI